MKPEVDPDRLCRAAYRSCMSLARVRQNVGDMIRQYAGDTYSEDGADKVVPLNLISLYHRVVLPKLVADCPQFALSTWNNDARGSVSTMEDVGNQAAKRMRLGNSLELVASSALFNSGWMKVGIAKGQDVGRYAYRLQKGAVFASPIAVDDICFDIHARTIDTAEFIGHRMRVPLYTIMDDDRYRKGRKERVNDLLPTEDKMYTEMGVERASMILRGYYGQDNDLFDMIELWEFYIPASNLTVVVTGEDVLTQSCPAPLLEEDWIGPKGGSPYHLCGFGPVPENLLPKAPIPDIMTLHEDVNNLLRKQIMQAKDQKKIVPVRPGSEGDVKRMMDTNNGEAFECANPEAIKELNMAGPDAQVFQFMMSLKELTDWSAGNISAVGGLAPQAKTATQEKMITATSSATVADMQRRMTDFAAGVYEHIFYYLWEDPFTTHDQPIVLEGLNYAIPRQVTPEQRRKLPVDQIKATIVPYSLQRETPMEVDQKLTEIVTQIVIPMLPLLQQSGSNFDIQEFLRQKAKLQNRPELLRLVSMQAPPETGGATSNHRRTMPQKTERSYERVNRSERTMQGEHNERGAAMMAAAKGSMNEGSEAS